MIIVKLKGGLGNQMFQYAAAKAIAKKKHDQFKIDLSFYSQQTLRHYELDKFRVDEKIASSDEIKKFAGKSTLLFKVQRKLGLKESRPSSYYYEKESAVFDKNVFEYQDNIYLDGYWQSENYFKDIRGDVLLDFQYKNEIPDLVQQYTKVMENNNSVSVHIRRGDYVSDGNANIVHGVCSSNYYKQAINYINNNVECAIFYIFSDDISWCENNFDYLENKVFVNDTSNSIDDLYLMRKCRHNIVANSSFSWWGAWLNEYSNKIVVAPKTWLSSDPNKTISLSKWVKL